ncbi:hypothetical protein NYE69_17950 [Paenibacillus sp. FSL R5-0527]|uniref:hypothetical protein n=1 Tax=Paenibacillus sp. FSL R5-0527 TaxID=2975321 RepID=UPI0030FB71A6
MSKIATIDARTGPEIKEQTISYKLHSLLDKAFRSNIRIILIMDELTSEQNETINNIINSFKLENKKTSTP